MLFLLVKIFFPCKNSFFLKIRHQNIFLGKNHSIYTSILSKLVVKLVWIILKFPKIIYYLFIYYLFKESIRKCRHTIIRIIWKINDHSAHKRQDLARLTEYRLMRFGQICTPLVTKDAKNSPWLKQERTRDTSHIRITPWLLYIQGSEENQFKI